MGSPVKTLGVCTGSEVAVTIIIISQVPAPPWDPGAPGTLGRPHSCLHFPVRRAASTGAHGSRQAHEWVRGGIKGTSSEASSLGQVLALL